MWNVRNQGTLTNEPMPQAGRLPTGRFPGAKRSDGYRASRSDRTCGNGKDSGESGWAAFLFLKSFGCRQAYQSLGGPNPRATGGAMGFSVSDLLR